MSQYQERRVEITEGQHTAGKGNLDEWKDQGVLV